MYNLNPELNFRCTIDDTEIARIYNKYCYINDVGLTINEQHNELMKLKKNCNLTLSTIINQGCDIVRNHTAATCGNMFNIKANKQYLNCLEQHRTHQIKGKKVRSTTLIITKPNKKLLIYTKNLTKMKYADIISTMYEIAMAKDK